MRVSKTTRDQIMANTTFQMSAKGPVAFTEISAEGKFIALDNTGRKVNK